MSSVVSIKGDKKPASNVPSIFYDAIPKYPSGKLLRRVLCGRRGHTTLLVIEGDPLNSSPVSKAPSFSKGRSPNHRVAGHVGAC